ncbi:MAG: triphosphoribosyl-dephospho-CoA synthase [Pirellulales bacterium]|nr:triphosphoribosyl-dephospho-CoA synthase [Pirellulales bacterium]
MKASPLTLGQCTVLACLLEATAPKPGNIHRGADFDDLTYTDLVAASIAIAPTIDRAPEQSLGQTALQAVRAAQTLVKTNANLGIILLVSPLAQVPRTTKLADGISAVLSQLSITDAADVYQAIREANPGGLGKVKEADVSGPPSTALVQAMQLAADRDLVARQYTNDFHEVLHVVVPRLLAARSHGWSLNDSIVNVHLQLLSKYPDSLIARKCGLEVARQAADHAAHVLSMGHPGDEAFQQALADFDFWLRSDGHRRNPGTTADLIAAGLFAALREGLFAGQSL